MDYISWIAIGIGGFLALIGLFDKSRRTTKDESDQLENRLRDLYKEESDKLRSKVEELTLMVTTLTRDMDRLKERNVVMAEILQGRDVDSLQFRDKAIKAIAIAEDSFALLKENNRLALMHNTEMEKLCGTMNTLIEGLKNDRSNH